MNDVIRVGTWLVCIVLAAGEAFAGGSPQSYLAAALVIAAMGPTHPAFPRIDGLEQGDPGRTDVICTPGMTLRDYFAGQVLTLFTMNADAVDRLVRGERPNHHTVATFCYEVADAMLAVRAHQEGEDDGHG